MIPEHGSKLWPMGLQVGASNRPLPSAGIFMALGTRYHIIKDRSIGRCLHILRARPRAKLAIAFLESRREQSDARWILEDLSEAVRENIRGSIFKAADIKRTHENIM